MERAINLFTDSDYKSFGNMLEALEYLNTSISKDESEIHLIEAYLSGKTPIHQLTLLNIVNDDSEKELVNVPFRERLTLPVSLLTDLNDKFGIYIHK